MCKAQAIPQNDILLVNVFIFLGIFEQIVSVASGGLVGIFPCGIELLGIVWPNYAYLRSRVCGLVWRNLSQTEWTSLAPPGLHNPSACRG